jgi:hypothetical protein
MSNSSPNQTQTTSLTSHDTKLLEVLALTNLDLMKNQRLQTSILLKQWWFLVIVISLLVGFVVLFLLDIYLGFREFIKWFDATNKSLSNAIPGNGFTLVLSYRHPFLSGIWYSNKAFPIAVILAYQYPKTNALLVQQGGQTFLQTMWEYASGLILQQPNDESVCQEPTQDFQIPGCIICSAFSQVLTDACLETCPGSNFSWMSAVGSVLGTTSMGLMTGAAVAGTTHAGGAVAAAASGASEAASGFGLIGALIGGLLALGLSLGSQIYESNQAKSQCVQQREQNLCNTDGAPSC